VLFTADTCALYSAVKVVGKFTEAVVEFARKLPHCIKRPFGNLEYPFADILEVPNVNVLEPTLAEVAA
jgi:hypothetical protein